MVRSFQVSAVFPALTALENVRVALQRPLGTSFHFWRSERSLSALDDRARGAPRGGRTSRTHRDTVTVELPYGRKRALELATTLALEPEVLLLDEPTQGMGHEDVGRVVALIRRVAAGAHRAHGGAQPLGRAGPRAPVTVLARGSVLAEGSYAEVSQDPGRPRGLHRSAPRERPGRAPRPSSCGCATCTPSTASRTSSTGWTSTVGDGRAGDAARAQRLGPDHDAARSILGLVDRRTGSVVVNGHETIGMAAAPDRPARASATARRSAASSRASPPRRTSRILPTGRDRAGCRSTRSTRCSRT